MIRNFTDRDTEQLFHHERNRRFNAIARVALRKLIQMNQARQLSDLSVPPGNRLEALKGELSGNHSIRVNSQWRNHLPLGRKRPRRRRHLRLPLTNPHNVIRYSHEITNHPGRNPA